MEQTGLDDRIDIKQGGHGSPYQVEYAGKSPRDEKPDNPSTSQIEHFQEMSHHAISDSEKNWWGRQLAEALGLVAVIWIKADLQEAFEAKRQLVMRTHQLAVQAARDRPGR